MFLKIGILKNFAKTLLLGSIFNKVAGLEAPTQLFSYEYCEIFNKSFFIEHPWWLLKVQG